MTARVRGFQSALMLAWSLALTSLTMVFGGVTLYPFRRGAGPIIYWLSVLGCTAIFALLKIYMFAATFLGVSLCVGLFAELELKGFRLLKAGTFAVLGSSMILGASFGLWTQVDPQGWYPKIQSEATKIAQQVGVFSKLPEGEPKTTEQSEALEMFESVLAQMPSAIVIMLMLVLMMTLLFEQPITKWMRLPKIPGRDLKQIHLPDFLVWALALALLFSFVDLKIGIGKQIAVNLLNVFVFLYFLQGMAVVSKAYEVFKVGVFWQILMNFIIIIQLFLFVVILGVSDYWINYRGRLVKFKLKQEGNNGRDDE